MTTTTTNLATKQPKTVVLAKHSGFCYGVKMAVDKAFELADSNKETVYVLGELIHNPQVVEKLKDKNVKTVQSIDEVPAGATCLIRTHGVGPEYQVIAKERDITVEDATCPDVRRVQERAMQLADEGYVVVLVGKEDHPEIKGIRSHTLHRADVTVLVVNSPEELDTAFEGISKNKIGVVTQTTQKEDNFFNIVAKLATMAKELKVFNTICPATFKRQYAAEDLAKEVEMVVVIGGKNSSNTTHLAEVSRQQGTEAVHIETVAELKDHPMLEKYTKIGVTAGASTPDWLVEDVLLYLNNYHLQ